MPLVFERTWLDWDADVKQIENLERRRDAGKLTEKGRERLEKLYNTRAQREKEQIFLTFFSEMNVQSALLRAQSRFRASPEVAQLLQDAWVPRGNTVTIKQGTHQPEDFDSGYILHFDAHSSRNGKTYHLYVGQLPSGSLKITRITYVPARDQIVEVSPDPPE